MSSMSGQKRGRGRGRQPALSSLAESMLAIPSLSHHQGGMNASPPHPFFTYPHSHGQGSMGPYGLITPEGEAARMLRPRRASSGGSSYDLSGSDAPIDFDRLSSSVTTTATAGNGSKGQGRNSGGRVTATTSAPGKFSTSRRATCHRCANVRKRVVPCSACPRVVCEVCAVKWVCEHGPDTFEGGCPICKNLCCCAAPANATTCPRSYHCNRRVRPH